MRSDMAAAAFVLVALAATIASLPAAESAVPTVDLGSEWLKVTIVNRNPGQPPISVAINEMSKRKSPAVVAFSSGLRLLGEEAAGIVARYPDKVYSQVRDMVGKPRGYVEELAAAAYLPLDLVEDARGAATIRADDGNGTVYSMEELLAMMAGIKEKPQLMMNHPHLEMGSLGRRSENEFDDEDLFSPVSLVRKAQSPGRSQGPPYSAAHQVGYPPKDLMTTMLRSLKIVVFTSKINLMLPFGPAAIFVAKFYEHPGLVFLLSLLGIIPLAERLGFATEQLAFFTGATVGGLLNATFGNATELIISILALKSGMIRVVQQSLLGSILSNMLLVLGCAFFSGGLVFHKKDQVFNKAAAVVNSGLLLMAVMGLLFPAVLHSTHTERQFGKSELALSRFSSCVMLVAYASYLVFQLKSHRTTYDPVNEGASQSEESVDDEVAEISKWEAIIWLAILTAWISVLSEYLVDAIKGASVAWKIPIAFISVVLLPIVGNAAEHASAIMFAMKDKLDISIGVAIGSSTQISMFGIPFCVVVGWIMGRPMDLNFQLFETATLFITVLVVAVLVQEGTSNYFKGLMLILCYLIVAASFYVHVDPPSDAL